MQVDADKLIEFAKTLEGQILETRKRKCQFTVRVTPKGMEYTPLSTDKARPQSYKWIKRVCEQFSLTNSFQRQEYSFTVHGSYVLALIEKYVKIVSNNSTTIDIYFFLWNPKKDTDSFTDYDKVQSDAQIGQPYFTRWICPSTKPRPDDIAFVQRTGKQNNGVFAKGIVTDTPYKDEHGVRVVGLKLDSFLPIGKEISREDIITTANYGEKWMPMASGNVVPEQLYQAILLLWNKHSQSDLFLPEEIKHQQGLPEGAISRIVVNAYERNAKARNLCIDHYGLDCHVCGFNFAAAYGDIGSGFIHVHHLIPLNKIQKKYQVDPIKDLRPVCPNCHAIIHAKEPPYTISEMRILLKNCPAKRN